MRGMSHANPTPITRLQREKQRALALAAITQATCLVEAIAQEGKCDRQVFEESMDALLDPDYIANRSFSLGSSRAMRLLHGNEIKFAKHILSHSATLISIEKKLAKQPEKLLHVGQGMERIHKQIQYFGSPYHDNIIAAIANLYGENISHINPRVIVRGKPEFLKQAHNTEQVRCLLFSGIRAAWVWRNNGGNALRLIFGRKSILEHLSPPSSHV